MRVAEVIGTVTLSSRHPEIPAAQFVIVRPQNAAALLGQSPASAEPLIAIDQLSVAIGERVSISEGREAAMPFHPDSVAVDAYCAAILDSVDIDT